MPVWLFYTYFLSLTATNMQMSMTGDSKLPLNVSVSEWCVCPLMNWWLLGLKHTLRPGKCIYFCNIEKQVLSPNVVYNNTHLTASCLFFLLGHNRKYPADLNVKFPDTTALVGQNITLECFALGK